MRETAGVTQRLDALPRPTSYRAILPSATKSGFRVGFKFKGLGGLGIWVWGLRVWGLRV